MLFADVANDEAGLHVGKTERFDQLVMGGARGPGSAFLVWDDVISVPTLGRVLVLCAESFREKCANTNEFMSIPWGNKQEPNQVTAAVHQNHSNNLHHP